MLRRQYQDIDLVTTGKGGRRTLQLLESLEYSPNERFNAMNAGSRALLYDLDHRRQIDVFIGDFRMCHNINLTSRLDAESRTIPLAELLLTKLQVVKLNRKDLVDIAALLYEHDVGEQDKETVNAGYIARLLASDWGLWRTSRGTVETVQERLADLELDADDELLVRNRLDRLWQRVESQPKSLRWRSRARIGDRARWYEEPEEVGRDQAEQ